MIVIIECYAEGGLNQPITWPTPLGTRRVMFAHSEFLTL